MRSVVRRAASALIALAAVVLLYVVVLRLYSPPISPAPPKYLDMCARPAAERPASCGGDGAATLLFAGDTAAIDDALVTLAARGVDHPFVASADRVRAADLAIVNYEAPITDGGDAFPRWRDTPNYRAPRAAAGALARAGFDIAGLANNHALDFGAAGLDDTLAALDGAGLAAVGAGRGAAAARRGVIVRLGSDLRVGLLAYCERKLAWDVYLHLFALGPARAGVAALDIDRANDDIAALRRAGADIVVVLAHWGDIHRPATAAELAAARALTEAGADLVVGHHPHVPQPVLLAAGRPAVLSLGNYAFGTLGDPPPPYGLLLVAHIRARRLARLELHPLDVNNNRVDFQPRPLTAAEARAALAPLLRDSATLGARLRMEGDHAVLDLHPPP